MSSEHANHRGTAAARSLSRRGAATAVAALLVGAGTGVAALSIPGAQAASAVSVSVDAARTLATVPANGLGVNGAVYDGNISHPAIPGLLKDAGINAYRYPGGSYGDIYHWKTHTTEGGWVASGTDFDTFVGTSRSAGAEPIVIANYGSGTATEAADWVRYANVTKGFKVKYWEIGNENYGNGHYGSAWEHDNHSDLSPRAYGNAAVQYISAMKAVDPTIKVGVVLTTPGSWPDGVVGPGDSADWNNTVLSIVGGRADFVIVHWYPGGTSPGDVLTKPAAQIKTMTTALRTLIAKYAGSNAANVGIAVTETNTSYQSTIATSALWGVDTYLTWWENGAFNVDWWNLHNGSDATPSTGADGTMDYHDGGILSSGSTGEPALNTPFSPYWGIAMVGRAARPGDTLVSATSSASTTVGAHAVRTADGGLNVVLVNKDLNASTPVTLSVNGFTASGSATVDTWVKNGTAITTATSASALSPVLPAYSITVVHLRPAGPTTTTSKPATTTTTTSTPPTSTTKKTTTKKSSTKKTTTTKKTVKKKTKCRTGKNGTTTCKTITKK